MTALHYVFAPRRDRFRNIGTRFGIASVFAAVLLFGSAFLPMPDFTESIPPMAVGSAAANSNVSLQLVSAENIGPGVRHEIFVVAGESPQAIHVVRVQRDNPFVTLTATLGRNQVEGTESVLNQARRLHRPGQSVVAGVNADFFVAGPIAGQPVGIHAENGELVVSPNGRPVFAIDKNGHPIIRMAELRGEVWRDGEFEDELFARASIDEVNRPVTRLELALYTPRLGADTPPVNGTLVTLRGIGGPLTPGVVHTGLVVATDAVRVGNGMRARIPDDGVVLAGRGPAQVLLDDLVPGEWVHFRVELADPLQDVTNAVAGWPVLLADGTKTELDGADPLVSGRHPRTAVGFNDDELVLVTVDGRQPGYADGMNLYELAELMAALGATDALNLDGGGSTTMLVRPAGQFDPVVVNRPSDGHDRAVANSLFVLSTAPRGTLTRLIPVPAADAAGEPELWPGRFPAASGAADPFPAASGATDPAAVPSGAADPFPAASGATDPAAVPSGAGDPTAPPFDSAVVRVLVGSRLPLSVLGQDGRHGPVAVDPDRVVWSATGAGDVMLGPVSSGAAAGDDHVNAERTLSRATAGDIGFGPQFIARRPGSALIRARSGLASGTLQIDVVDAVAAIVLRPDIIHLTAGETVPLSVQGFDEAGRPVRLNPDLVEWSIDSSVSTISADDPQESVAGVSTVELPVAGVSAAHSAVARVSADGLVTGMRGGETVVRGRLGAAVATARIVVDKPPVPLPNFGSPGLWFANAARARATLSFTTPPEPLPDRRPTPSSVAAGGAAADPGAVAGEGAARLAYDFTGAEGATAAAYVQAVEPIPLADRPTAIGVWVHADNNEHWLRANIFDGEGTRHVIDFTSVGGITWSGWRWVTAPLPQDIPLPISFERIYVAEIHRHRQTPGVLYFTDLQALYATPATVCGREESRSADC